MALYPSSNFTGSLIPTPSTNPVVASATIGTSSSQILAANATRQSFSVYNNSNRTIALGFVTGVTLTANYFTLIPANALYEWSQEAIPTGAIFAIASGANAAVQISELNP
ncbi:hypothetical protein V2H45_05915 [Tumidithrix elongata RA019]|uniref:Uncharacterized protein n=1 Tax=Tumidithrix elongata BACA0141 TaxID=2716417 RepID=A0AAW9PRK6_9CYAN|nr:hypothetical protein [Tumidithrix elongata RA019]